jgi:hypothetical protein
MLLASFIQGPVFLRTPSDRERIRPQAEQSRYLNGASHTSRRKQPVPLLDSPSERIECMPGQPGTGQAGQNPVPACYGPQKRTPKLFRNGKTPAPRAWPQNTDHAASTNNGPMLTHPHGRRVWERNGRGGSKLQVVGTVKQRPPPPKTLQHPASLRRRASCPGVE